MAELCEHFDIISDVHGHLDELTELLTALGFEAHQGVWQHPERQAVFVGDLIDQGPCSGEVLSWVHTMAVAGQARLVVGNHELELLAFLFKRGFADLTLADPESLVNCLLGSGARSYGRLGQCFADQPQTLADILVWLSEQPLWIHEPGLKVVHACWDDNAFRVLEEHGVSCLQAEVVKAWIDREEPIFSALDLVVAGCQLRAVDALGAGKAKRRQKVRWWPDALADYAQLNLPFAAGVNWDETQQEPIFFGHYSLSDRQQPSLISGYQVCTDFGVASGGFLVAYRHQRFHPASVESFFYCA